MDICHYIKIEAEELKDIEILHAHLTLLEDLGKIALRIYVNEPFDENKNKIIDWIKSQKNYSEFGKSIKVTKINDPESVIYIDYTKSKIGAIFDAHLGNDKDGKFFAIAFKRVDLKTKQVAKFENNDFKSEIYLDNFSYDLFYRLVYVDGFESNSKVWKSNIANTHLIKFKDIQMILDFNETLSNDESNYPNLLVRLPRILVYHKDIGYEKFLEYTQVLCSAISFFQGHNTEYEKLFYNSEEAVYYSYFPQKEKLKYLTRNLGRFNIKKHLFEFLNELSCNLLKRSDFTKQIVLLFNQAIVSEGSTQFMLCFTVIEKLRNEYFPPNQSKEKFSFIDSKKAINCFIREKLQEIKNKVVDTQHELWKASTEDKLSNLKYLPQKDQFTDFFYLVELQPNEFNLDWTEVVTLRGNIFHGKFIESDDTTIIELNSKMITFTGNLIYKYMTTKKEINDC